MGIFVGAGSTSRSDERRRGRKWGSEGGATEVVVHEELQVEEAPRHGDTEAIPILREVRERGGGREAEEAEKKQEEREVCVRKFVQQKDGVEA